MVTFSHLFLKVTKKYNEVFFCGLQCDEEKCRITFLGTYKQMVFENKENNY